MVNDKVSFPLWRDKLLVCYSSLSLLVGLLREQGFSSPLEGVSLEGEEMQTKLK